MRCAAAALAAFIAAPALAQDAVGIRIAQSAAAAERMQGPLDGTWALVDARGRTLFTFQIGDPPSHRSALSCAWHAPDRTFGPADCRRSGPQFVVVLREGAKARAVLERTREGVWRGEFHAGGAAQPVTLRRR